jgi:hypothetical protein
VTPAVVSDTQFAALRASYHVSNYGIGTRLNVPSWAPNAADTYAFIEASRGYVNQVIAPLPNDSSRIFSGILAQY